PLARPTLVALRPARSLHACYPGILLIRLPEFPALNNSGDQIIIRDDTGQLLDSLSYDSNWGGAQKALERRTVSVSANYPSNWADAPNGFGTPGSINEIGPDTQSPRLQSFIVQNDQEFLIRLSEQLSASSAQNISNYTISGNTEMADARFFAPDSILLKLDRKLENATPYTLQVSGVEDIFGNAMAATDTTFTYYIISPVDSSDIFINEFHYAPPSGETEYIELHNPTTRSFDLQGWTLSDNRNAPAIMTNGPFTLPPDSFVVIAPDNTLLSEYPDILLLPMGNQFPSLNNSGDAIVVRDSSGLLLDSLSFTSSWSDSTTSLERRSTAIPAVFKENWDHSPHPSGGTPGAANQVERDLEAPSLRKLIISSDQKIFLAFDERLGRTAFTADNYNIARMTIKSVTKAGPDQPQLTLSDPLTNARSYQLTLSNIPDIFGNTISIYDATFTFFEESAVDSGD